MLLTFFEVLIGLLILKKDYAFLISLGIAAVDLLPLLGAGSVLLPWAIVSFIMRDTQTAMGLLILYGIIVVVRQIAEPRIVGSSIGISPIASLFSMYVGLKLFGLIGMILGPAAAFVISELVGNESGDEAPKNNI